MSAITDHVGRASRACVGAGLVWLAGAAAMTAQTQDPATDPWRALAERYVKLVLAIGPHDADYVDAYYGPPEWRTEAEASPVPLAALSSTSQLTSVLAVQLHPMVKFAVRDSPGAATSAVIGVSANGHGGGGVPIGPVHGVPTLACPDSKPAPA